MSGAGYALAGVNFIGTAITANAELRAGEDAKATADFNADQVIG